MKRRHFSQVLAGGALGAGAAGYPKPGLISAYAAPAPRKNLLMHVGGDYHSIAGGGIASKENLEYTVRHGANHLTAQVRGSAPEGAWDLEELKVMKDNCEKHGVVFEGIRMDSGYILLKKGPERDRKIETIQENIRKASQVGVKVISYHWTVIPIRRNGSAPGRGGSTYDTFTLEKNWKELPAGKAGRVTHDDYWERITYFLEKIIPVAAEYDVRMGAHPYDPPGLPLGYQGADNWDSPVLFDALKRHASIVESPYNGFQLCIGTCYEGLCITDTNREQIYEIVRYFGERKKLFSIHLRNIKGSPGHFAEVYPDEGDMDFYRIIKILRDVQYPWSILPDHLPRHPDDKGHLQAFAFGYGYIKALIQAANAEAV